MVLTILDVPAASTLDHPNGGAAADELLGGLPFCEQFLDQAVLKTRLDQNPRDLTAPLCPGCEVLI